MSPARPGLGWRHGAAAAVLLAGMIPSGQAGAQPAGWKAQLDQTIPAGMGDASLPGVIVGVWKPGQVPYVRAFGVRDISTGEPMTTDLSLSLLELLRDRFDSKIFLAGFSFGATFAAQAALRHPDLVAALVATEYLR